MAEHIVIRIPNWLGDTIMATAGIRALRRRHPDDAIALVGLPAMLSVFSSTCCPFELIPYDRRGSEARLPGLLRMSALLREKRFTQGYLLTNSFSSALMFFLGRVQKRTGYRGQWRSALLTEAVKAPPAGWHHADLYHYLLNRGEPAELLPEIRIAPEEREKARQLLEQEHCLGALRIGLAIGAAYGPAKRWPVEYFAVLARECARRFNARLLIFGTEADEADAAFIEQAAGGAAINLAGQTNLRELFALLQQCRLVVANDSGAMHAAAAVQTPVIALFGSTDPGLTGPLGPPHRVIYKPVDCSPCFERTCPLAHYQCLRRITVEDVLNQAEELLPGQRALL